MLNFVSDFTVRFFGLKMKAVTFTVLSTLIICCAAQRSPYAGRSPHGYPSVVVPTSTVNPLDNRFGDVSTSTSTTMRLPIEALGDAELVRRLMKLPLDKRPFWLLNSQALEIHRAQPQTYSQRHNNFFDRNRG